MSAATRRIRVELAIDVLVALGGLAQDEVHAMSDERRVDEAQLILSERVQSIIAQLCDVGISKAKIAREI